jgi:hypothetical protein
MPCSHLDQNNGNREETEHVKKLLKLSSYRKIMNLKFFFPQIGYQSIISKWNVKDLFLTFVLEISLNPYLF